MAVFVPESMLSEGSHDNFPINNASFAPQFTHFYLSFPTPTIRSCSVLRISACGMRFLIYDHQSRLPTSLNPDSVEQVEFAQIAQSQANGRHIPWARKRDAASAPPVAPPTTADRSHWPEITNHEPLDMASAQGNRNSDGVCVSVCGSTGTYGEIGKQISAALEETISD